MLSDGQELPAPWYRCFDGGYLIAHGTALVKLPRGFYWAINKVEMPLHKIVSAEALITEGGRIVGALYIADVTADPTEPWIRELCEENLAAADQQLREGTQRTLLAQSAFLCQWEGSQLLNGGVNQFLWTECSMDRAGKISILNCMRFTKHERKLAIMTEVPADHFHDIGEKLITCMKALRISKTPDGLPDYS